MYLVKEVFAKGMIAGSMTTIQCGGTTRLEVLHDIPKDVSKNDDEVGDDEVVEHKDGNAFELGESGDGVGHIPRLGNDGART